MSEPIPALAVAPPDDPRAARLHALRLSLDLLRWSSRQTNDRAILRQEALRGLRTTPAGWVKWRRIRYSADARIKQNQERAAAVLAEIQALELEASL